MHPAKPNDAPGHVATIAGLVAVALGLSVLAGRFLGIPRLVTVYTGGPPVAFITALGYLLGGVGVISFGRGNFAVTRKMGSGLMAGGLGLLAFYAAEQLFFPVHFPALGSSGNTGTGNPIFAGRMSVSSATAFAILGLAVWSLGQAVRPTQRLLVCLSLVFTTAFGGLATTLTGLQASAAWWRFTGMALQTSVTFLVLSGGLLFIVAWRAPEKERTLARSAAAFAIAIGMILVIGVISLVNSSVQAEAQTLVQRSMEIHKSIDHSVNAMTRLEATSRTYALTGQDSLLPRYEANRRDVHAQLAILTVLLADSAPQMARMKALKPHVERKLAFNDSLIAARKAGAGAAEIQRLIEDSRQASLELTAIAVVLEHEEERLLGNRESEMHATTQRSSLVVGSGFTLAILMLAAAFHGVMRAQRGSLELNELLEQRVNERTLALANKEDSFRFMADSMPQIVWTTTPAGTLEYHNKRWFDYTRLTREETTNGGWIAMIHPEDVDETTALWRSALGTGREFEVHYRLQSGNNGAYRWHLARAYPQRDAAGQIVRWVGTATDIHDQKEAHTELERLVAERTAELAGSQGRLLLLANSLPVMIAQVSKDERYLFTNQTYQQQLGMDPQRMLGRTVHEVFGDEVYALLRPRSIIALGGQRVSFVRDMVYEGRTLHLGTDYIPNPVDGGYYVLVQDLTKWKKAEAELRSSADRLSTIFNTVAEGLILSDHDGVIVECNSAAERILGLTRDQLTGRSPLDPGWRVTRGDGSKMPSTEYPTFAVALSGQPERNMIMGVHHATGEVRWIEVNSEPISYVAGERHSVITSFTDFTARRSAEMAVRENEQFLQGIFRGVELVLTVLDVDEQGELSVVAVNPAHERQTGIPAKDLVGRKFSEHPLLDTPAKQDEVVGCYLASVRSGQSMSFETQIMIGGVATWWLVQLNPLRDAAGTIFRVVSSALNVTERKQLEQTLAKARDQALESSRMKSEFLAMMSHEIRTPMNGVIGMTNLLRGTNLTETQADYVRTIDSSGDSLLTIINDILDYSKMEAGRIDLELAPFDLRHCIEEALDLFAGTASRKKIELAHHLLPGVPTYIEGDGTRLRQILVNLVGNALKFTSQGEVVVTTSAERVGDRYRICFSIKDTGIGISPEGMARLFKSFSQVDASTTRRYGGTGLGLVISRNLALMMGGDAWAESKVGEGSTFHVTILAEPRELHSTQNLGVPEPGLDGRHLLVVDPSATCRQTITLLASAWGMKPHEATSAAGAFAWLRSGAACDVVIVDQLVPGTDVDDFARSIRALPGRAGLALVSLAEIGTRQTTVTSIRALSKPVKRDALFGALRSSLAIAAPARRGESASPLTPQDVVLAERHPLRLLVAEDNAVNQKVIKALLQQLGYRATIVANGQEAVAATQAADYDAILMDIEMPEVDGCGATQQIRAERGSPDRPWIIALTASAMQTDRERAFAAGMNAFLTKPIRSEALSEALALAHAMICPEPDSKLLEPSASETTS